MNDNPGFNSTWNHFRHWTFDTEQEEPENLCEYAQMFAAWTAKLCSGVEKQQDIVAVNCALVLLVQRYFEWRASVPKSHRNRFGDQGHVCIFHIFERAYQRIRVTQLTLQPVITIYPTALPPAAPDPEENGIDLGEFIDV